MPNIERLRQLRRVVAAAPDDERFDMRFIDKEKGCGTAHCAYGWARVDPWFLEKTEIRAMDYLASPGEFDLSPRNVEWLFDPPITGLTTGPTMKALVLANIDRLIAGQPAIPYPVEIGSTPGDPA
jgi:hypothetical protein